ncbi:MAG: hypothetical protein NTU61_00525, partial [Candidatus Altiarchaeota archaeon]|nr:hypothetical protein [Candidatus Altiarchaeota archaeon]
GSGAAAPGGGGGSGGGPSPSPPAGPAPSAPSTPSPSPPAGPTTTPSTTTPPTPSTPSAGPGPSGPAAPSAPVSAAPVHPSGGQPTGAQAAPAPSPAQPSGEAAGQTGGAGFWARAKRAGAQFGRNNVNPWNLALGASILTGQGGLALGISAAMGATKVVKGIRESRRAREQKEELPKSTRKVKGYLNDLFGTEARTKGESFSGVEYRSGKFMIGNEQVTRDRIDAAHRTVDAAAMGGTIGYADKVLGAASKVGGEEYGGVSADAGKLRTGDSGVSRKDLKKAAKTVRKDKTGAVTPEERAQIKKADKARREPSEISNYEYARISSGREMLKKELQGDPSLRQAFEPGGVPEAQPPAPSPAESPGERRQAGGQMGFDFMKGESEGTESREAPGEGAAATQAAAREGGEKAGSKRPDDRGPGPQVGRAQKDEEKIAEVRKEEEAPHQGDDEMTDAEKEEQEKAKPRRKDRGGGESGG